MDFKELLLFFLLFIFVGGGLFYFFLLDESGDVKPVELPNFGPQGVVNDNGLIEDSDGVVVGVFVSSDGSSPSSGSGGSDISGLDCYSTELTFALRNFYEDINCTSYNLNGCTNIIASCGVNIENLNDYVPGTFEFVYYLKERISGNVVSETFITKNLLPRERKNFGTDFNVQDLNGIPEDLECDVETVSIPVGIYCS